MRAGACGMSMSSWLTQYQSIRSSTDRLIIAIEDLNDLWPAVKDAFEERIQFKRMSLNNKARNPVNVEKLLVEYVLTTDPRLRTQFAGEQSPFRFRYPYATILLLTCEDLDDYKSIVKPRVKSLVNDEREWFIVFITKPNAQDPAGKQAKRVYSKLEVDFSSKRRERCCKLELNSSDPISWEEIEARLGECIRNVLDKRIQFYEEEIRKLNEQRLAFVNIFIMKESLAFMFELARLHEDALREYDELEQVYLELVNTPTSKPREFGGTAPGDDSAALLDARRKPITQFAADDSFKEFDFRQYLFARQATVLFNMNRPIDVASRGLVFVFHFSQKLSFYQRELPFCMREVWVITACIQLAKATSERFSPRSFNPEYEKDFYRFQADLNSLARTKLMRLADLIGYGSFLERSPCNSALLSMAPWPRPSVWPSVPPDAGAKILAKEQSMQEISKTALTSSNQLPLAPTMLLREANRRRASFKDSPVADGQATPPQASPTNAMQRSLSIGSPRAVTSPIQSPSMSRSGFDPPMKLAEIHAAAEHEILKLVSHEELRKALSSFQGFEEMYMALTREAADYYHRSRKRHGVVLDGELAAVHYRKGNFDTAAKLYEKVCALYSGERWDLLLAEVLPRLLDCQKQLGDHAGFLSSCVKLLSLDHLMLQADVRKGLQSELLRVAHSGLKVPVPVDVSTLITFCGKPGPPLELCEADLGTLAITIWSGFPDEVPLDSLNMAITPSDTTDERSKAIKTAETSVLQPGKNTVVMQIQPQKPGSYVLSTFTGQIGQLQLRSHACCAVSAGSSKGGPAESDDQLSTEKPLRPVVQVLPSRPLVVIDPLVTSALLIGDPQWLGLVIRPLGYSLRGAIVHVTTQPGLVLYSPQVCQMQPYQEVGVKKNASLENGVIPTDNVSTLELEDGKAELPAWSSDAVSVMWFRVLAKRLNTGSSAKPCSFGNGPVTVQPTNAKPEGAHVTRNLDVKLEFGLARSRVYERTMTLLFTEAFSATTNIVKRGNAGMLLLQVKLASQIASAVTIYDATLHLQAGFSHAGKSDGKPEQLSLLPISMSGNAECALLFSIKCDTAGLETGVPNGQHQGREEAPEESSLTIQYTISGNRSSGAHFPEEGENRLVFKSSFLLQMPVFDQLVSVGMLPVPCARPRVGEQVVLQWRIERLKRGTAGPAGDSSAETEELSYQIKASSETWMVAGKKKGYVALSTLPGARVIVSMACVPLVAGHVHPPALELYLLDQAHISQSPPGPHLVCIFPPVPCSAFCVTSKR